MTRFILHVAIALSVTILASCSNNGRDIDSDARESSNHNNTFHEKFSREKFLRIEGDLGLDLSEGVVDIHYKKEDGWDGRWIFCRLDVRPDQFNFPFTSFGFNSTPTPIAKTHSLLKELQSYKGLPNWWNVDNDSITCIGEIVLSMSGSKRRVVVGVGAENDKLKITHIYIIAFDTTMEIEM